MYGRSGKTRGNTVSKVICFLTISCKKKQSYSKYVGMEKDPHPRRRKHCLKAVELGRHTNLRDQCGLKNKVIIGVPTQKGGIWATEGQGIQISLSLLMRICQSLSFDNQSEANTSSLQPVKKNQYPLSPRNWGEINVIQP